MGKFAQNVGTISAGIQATELVKQGAQQKTIAETLEAMLEEQRKTNAWLAEACRLLAGANKITLDLARR